MWHHIADYNLQRCRNPLHQFHRVPVDPQLEPDIDYMYRAAKYVEKTFTLFDSKTGVNVDVPSAFDALVASIEAESATMENKSDGEGALG